MTKFRWGDDVAYNDSAKRKWHNRARRQLKAVAVALGLPEGSYDLRSNKAGPAVSGEVTLHGENIYVQASQSVMGERHGILIRTVKGRKDYTGGINHFAPLAALDDPRDLANYIKPLID
jgi:hypothetical protein